jgi:hypothetical protein
MSVGNSLKSSFAVKQEVVKSFQLGNDSDYPSADPKFMKSALGKIGFVDLKMVRVSKKQLLGL